MPELLTLIDLLEMLVRMPVAPWVLRMLLYLEKQGPEGFTEEELYTAIRIKFDKKLQLAIPYDTQIRDDVTFLLQQLLIKWTDHTKIILTEKGRLIAGELTPASVPV